MKLFAACALFGLLLAPSCGGTAPTPPSSTPSWVTALIAQFQRAPVGNPRSVYRYTYNGQTVYYVPPQCCDQLSALYDSNGRMLCAPDGGITGQGDGRCADFFQQRTNAVLVWRDAR